MTLESVIFLGRYLFDLALQQFGPIIFWILIPVALLVIAISPLIILSLLRWVTLGMERKRKVYCLNCGHQGLQRRKLNGHFSLEALGWLFFWAPGIIYSAWRWVKKGYKCPACGSFNMIFASSPEAIAKMKAG